MNDSEVLKLGIGMEWNDVGIAYRWYDFGVIGKGLQLGLQKHIEGD